MTPRHSAPARPRVARHARTVRSHRLRHVAALTTVAVLSFGATSAATAYVRLENNIETHDVTAQLGEDRPVQAEPVDPTDPNSGRPLNILLMGSDVRDGANAEIGGAVDGMRSDTTIVMHISADRTRVELVSIPRDSHVEIPDCPRSDGTVGGSRSTRFNEAFSIGSQSGNVADAAACTIKTVESLTNVFIDGWVVVDFAGFVNMVDALGGIPMCIPNDMTSPKAGLQITAGQHTLDGTTALAYARARTGQGVGDGSDTNRLGRQQQLLAATATEVLSKNLLTDSTKLYLFLNAATQSLTADPDTGNVSNLAGLAFSLRDVPSGNITFMTIPFGAWSQDPNQVVWTSEADTIWANMAADVPIVPPAAPTPPTEPVAPGTDPAVPEQETPPEQVVTEAPKPGVDPFTPDDVQTVCG
ncbi:MULTISPECIES: LCP family protein [unclassified Actinotalea]|uniref:LCP family protein n=1 Tax=unclassified Actinotalea TaxID=2638618 RepID=UPI0021035B2C|nr:MULTISPECIES: LCP family protein [unclassified Actinotalea]